MSKRKDARAVAHKLRNDPSWGAPVKSDPMQKLMELDQEARDKRVFSAADACAACESARAKTDDETALCETHLAEVMGFG